MKSSNPYVQKIKDFSNHIFEAPSDEDIISLRETVQKVVAGAERVIVEIGSGSGNHIVNLAARDPSSVHMGFELRFKRAYRTVEKSRKIGLSNVFVVRHDAKAIESLFNYGQIDKIYINFPDPWDKRKRRKNRTLNNRFLDSCNLVLKAGGTISFKTDHAEYFESFLKEAERDIRFKVEAITSDLHQSRYAENNVITEFEAMFVRESTPIKYCLISKR